MLEMYGHAWASQQGDQPNDTWLRGLEGLNGEQLAVGLRACLEREGQFPPVLPEFRRMCLGLSGGMNFSGATRAHQIYRGALPNPRTEELEEVARREIAKMRKLFEGKAND